MSLPAMRQVLAASPAHISVLGFDACLMATAETLNAVAPSVDYLAASEETEGADGWNYTKLAQDLSAMTDVRSFASTITQSGRTNSELSTFSTVQANGNTLDAAIATEAAKIGLTADETAKVTQAANDLLEVAVSFATRKLVPAAA